MDINQQNVVVNLDDEFIQYLINEGFFGNLAKSLVRSVPRKIADGIRNKKQAVADKANEIKNKIKHGATKAVQKVSGKDEDTQRIIDVTEYIKHQHLFGTHPMNITRFKDIPYGVMPRAQLLKIWDSAKKSTMVTDVDRTALFEDTNLKKIIDETFITTVFLRIQKLFDDNKNVKDIEEAIKVIPRLCENLVKVSILYGVKDFGNEEVNDYANQTVIDNKFDGIKILLPVYNKFAVMLAPRLKINLQRKIKDMSDIEASRDQTVNRNLPSAERNAANKNDRNRQQPPSQQQKPAPQQQQSEPQEPESARASRERREKAKAGKQQQPQQQAKPSRVAKKPRGNVPPRRTSRRRDRGEQEQQAA